MKRTKLTAGGSVIAAIFASLCCIGPVLISFAGVGSVGVFVMFEAYRTLFIVAAAVLIAAAFYLAYRRQEIRCEDGTCKHESARMWTKYTVWGAAVVTAFAIAFPYFGLTPVIAMSRSYENSVLNLDEQVSFFSVSLVCNAAPTIGCGSKSKFIMLDLMKEQAVNEAWLNRKGTVMAVVWNEGANSASRQQSLKSVFSKHEVPLEQVPEQERALYATNFRTKDEWFKGSDVDALSIEEAGIIADQILGKVSPHVRFKQAEDKLAFHKDVQAIIERCFLSITSYKELNDSMNQNISRDITLAGEKYLGKGKMPDLQLRQSTCEHGNTSGSCTQCTTGETKQMDACCPPETGKKKQ